MIMRICLLFKDMLSDDGGASLVEYATAMCLMTIPAFALLIIGLQGPSLALHALGNGGHTSNTTKMPTVAIPTRY